jgi:protein SCO1
MASRRSVLRSGVSLAVSWLGAPLGSLARERDGVSMRDIKLPDVALTRSDGQTVHLRHELEDGPPVILNFIFTSCPGICPMMSQVFAQLQRALAAQHNAAVLVSISTDPEQDTPAQLREYASRFGAHENWRYYTGTVEASESVQRAFEVYNGDKMSHAPVTFMHVRRGQGWQRVEGLATAAELLGHYHALEARMIAAAR